MVFTLKKPFSLHRAIKGLLNEVKLCIGFTLIKHLERRLAMTQNEIAYWNLQEAITNHRNVEKETNRANLARETETNRSNLAVEAETKRANIARERENQYRRWQDYKIHLDQYYLQKEQNRFNNDLAYKRLEEDKRSNRANEQIQEVSAKADYNRASEQARHNRAEELAKQRDIANVEFKTKSEVSLAQRRQRETERMNLAQVDLQAGTLTETQRRNLADEAIRRFQNTLTENRLIEEVRSNMARESISRESNSINRERNQIEVFKTTLHEANSLFQNMANTTLRSNPIVYGGAK